jgi:hypothetical protein
MSGTSSSKVSASHLGRKAYLYVRQSTLRQVIENTESTRRQYALRGGPRRSLCVAVAADGAGFLRRKIANNGFPT